MEFEEACSAVADLFEALPETWTINALARDENGVGTRAADPSAVSWCAIGGLLVTYGHVADIGLKLQRYSNQLGYPDAVTANNIGGRLVAIKMLRLAAGVA